MMTKSIKVWALALSSVAMAGGTFGLVVGGCGGGGSGTTSGDGGTGTGPGSSSSSSNSSASINSSAGTVTCTEANDIFEIVFAPMYSAVIPGNSDHSFQIPAIVAGVAASDVTWSASSTAVSLSADPSTGGVLITMNPSGSGGTVTITASAGGSCGQSTLNITATTVGAWDAGSARYNDGVPIPTDPKQLFEPDAGPGSQRVACVNCHSPKGADAGMGGFGFNDVAHTPEQTGGYSDQQLLDIVQNGAVPGWSTDAATVPGLEPGQTSADAGYFDTTITSFEMWHRFHQWNLTTAEQAGIVTYLRSLTPTAQGGTSNFGGFGGGRPPPDGGYHFGDGGFHHHHGDGGAPPPEGDGGT